jgi:amidase
MLDLLAGYELGDASWAPPPAEPFAAAAAREPGRLRIGVTTAMPIEAELDPVAAAAVTEASELLASLGHEVEEFEAPWRGANLLELFTMVFGTGISTAIYFGGLVTGREPTEDLVEPLSWETWKIIQGRGGMDYLLARTQLQAVSRAWMGAMDAYDVVLTPALGQRPVRIGELDACSSNPLDDFRRSGHFTPYTASFNVSGQPAISLPLFHGDDGLPLAVQLVGRPADEATLLSLGAQLEAAHPWADRRPELAAA